MRTSFLKKTTHHIKMEGRHIITHGLQTQFWQDIYHYAMTSNWPRFLGGFAFLFISLNFIFASLYLLGENAIANIYPEGFLGAFFFSVETLATVGYGDMHPQTFYGHLISTIEIFTGLTGLAMVTGVMFARFSRPKARIIFAKYPVTYHHNEEYVLSLRIANARLNIIGNASAKLFLLRLETTKENTPFMRIIDLPLKRDQHPMFSLGWTIFHVIDEHSPLYQMTSKELKQLNARLVLNIEGVDETTSQTVRARQTYMAESIRLHHRYKDITVFDDNDIAHMDYRLFDQLVEEKITH